MRYSCGEGQDLVADKATVGTESSRIGGSIETDSNQQPIVCEAR